MREADIRPPDAFAALLDDARKSSEKIFHNGEKTVWMGCPACGLSARKEFAFSKKGYLYHSCHKCGSLFLTPRPDRDAISRFYQTLTAFDAFYDASRDARREHIVRPRAKRIAELAEQNGITGTFFDIGCGTGDLLDEVASNGKFSAHAGIEPSHRMASAAMRRGFSVTVSDLEDSPLENTAGMATAFEILEHVFSPMDFLRSARNLLVPGGILCLTTLTCDGWDIMELREKHGSVCPPLHMNLMSIEGLCAMVDACGLELMEISTPGRLDVDILRNALAAHPEYRVSKFARRMASEGESVRDAFQAFLREHLMSSHVQVVARRPLDRHG